MNDAFHYAAQPTEILIDVFNHKHEAKESTDAVLRAILPRLNLHEIEPHEHDLIDQLAGRDNVHMLGAASRRDLLDFRIGGKQSTKTAFALTFDNAQGRKTILTAIYATRLLNPIADVETDVPGNVHSILTTPCEPLRGRRVFANEYISISNLWVMKAGAGRPLMHKLLEFHESTPDLRHITLSPFRVMQKRYREMAEQVKITPAMRRVMVIQRMLEDAGNTAKDREEVGNFHRSNGAQLAGIRNNANVAGSADDTLGMNMMVHWEYVRDRIPMNLAAHRKGDILSGILPGIKSREEQSYAIRKWAPLRGDCPLIVR